MSSKAFIIRAIAFLTLVLPACSKTPDPVVTIPFFNGPIHEIKVSSLLENAAVYPLATTSECMIGSTFFFLDCIDEYYILDKSAEKVFRFGQQGEFLNTIGKMGKASVLFCEPIISKVYEINSSGIQEKYRLDFGKFSIGEDLFTEELQKRSEDPGLWIALKVLENKSFVFLYTGKDLPDSEVLFQHFLFRKEDKTLWTLPDEAGFSDSLGPAFHLTDKDELYLYLTPSEADQSKTWKRFFEDRKLILDAGDNPVIVKLDIEKVIAFATDEKR